MADTQSYADLINKLYGQTEQTNPYLGVVNQGFTNLGQPGTDNDRMQITSQFVTGLANSFADQYLKQTGQLPSEDMVKSYVANNATTGNAMKYVTNTISPDQMNEMAKQYIQSNPDIGSGTGSQQSITDRIMGLNNQLNAAYESGKTSLISGINDIYGQQKTNLVNDLAGQGMLTQPNSRYSLDALEANKGKSIASGLNELEGARAAGQVDLATTVENLLAGERRAGENMNRFNREYSANRDDMAFNQGLENRKLTLAQILGRYQANSGKRNGLSSGLGGAASGALSGAAIGSAVPGIGTAVGAAGGALLGGLGGYFGSQD